MVVRRFRRMRRFRRPMRRRMYRRRIIRRRGPGRNLRRGGRLGIETKYVDGYVENQAVRKCFETADLAADNARLDVGQTSTTTGNIFICAQGDGASQRDGQRIIVKSIIMKGHVMFPHRYNTAVSSDTITQQAIVHVFVILDTQSNGVPPTLSDVFVIPTVVSYTADGPSLLQRNMNYGNRFVILKHKVFRDGPSYSDIGDTSILVESSPMNIREFKWAKRMRMPVTYDPTNTTGNFGIRDNSIHVFAVANNYSGTGTPNGIATLTYNVRTRFVG